MILKVLKNFISKGFRPKVVLPEEINYITRVNGTIITITREEAFNRFYLDSKEKIGFILPTYVDSMSIKRQLEQYHHYFESLREAAKKYMNFSLVVFVAMQWKDGQREEARQRLEKIMKLDIQDDFQLIAFSCKAQKKTSSLNIAISIAQELKSIAIGWIDDDVILKQDCLKYLIKDFLNLTEPGAVGANKIGIPVTNKSSKIFFKLKSVTTPAMNYPHGCCMLVSAELIKNGIPERYHSDDGYICFELIRPNKDNPFDLLKITNKAICYHFVGGELKNILKRIRRLLLFHVIFMADYPINVATYYFKYSLFYGLWPLAPWDRNKTPILSLFKWLLKAIYFMVFVTVAIELAIRGIINKPLEKINWG